MNTTQAGSVSCGSGHQTASDPLAAIHSAPSLAAAARSSTSRGPSPASRSSSGFGSTAAAVASWDSTGCRPTVDRATEPSSRSVISVVQRAWRMI